MGARVRVVTAAGLRVGLARRVFAREPLLPSDVEAEEEQQVRSARDCVAEKTNGVSGATEQAEWCWYRNVRVAVRKYPRSPFIAR